MTTQTTTNQPSTKGTRALIGATVCTVAVLSGAVLWQARPGDHVAPPATSQRGSTSNEGAPALGGLAERYREQARSAADEREARVTSMGGMAELYAAQAGSGSDGAPDGSAEQTGAEPRYVYLVGSQVAATAIRQFAVGAGQIHVVETEEDASRVRAGFIGRGVTVIDLRGAPGACGTDFVLASC